jgi:1,2-phenylacetyl-CoA epoxidase catalytic subunit
MANVTAQRDATSYTDQISYEDLYRRWEEGNWKAYDIDFAKDREGWEGLTEIQRKSALWTYSMFFYGEDSVTDNLSPYIDAAPKEEQKYFLATQQVDEARHAVFFHRLFREVIEAGSTIGSTLAYTEPQLGWGYRNVFDRLDRMGEELRRDRSLPKFAQAIALYHMVVEATLAQPGQHFIEDYFTKSGTMPGFSEGMHNVSRDEQRHIGFGVKTLSECFRESEECKAAVAEILREVMRYSMAVFVPPGWDLEYTRCYGFELEDIYSFGMRSVEAKWKAAGWPIDEMPPDVYPFDMSLPHKERAPARHHADARRRRRRAGSGPRLLPGGSGAPVRRDRTLGSQRRGQRKPGDHPVALRGRGAVVPADRQRQLAGRSGRGPGSRPHAGDHLARLDRPLHPRRRPPPCDAPAQAATARLAAHAVADAADLPPLRLARALMVGYPRTRMTPIKPSRTCAAWRSRARR